MIEKDWFAVTDWTRNTLDKINKNKREDILGMIALFINLNLMSIYIRFV
tara:strand:+ start:731 stop:877 length:147 start_codon:yes stop_codon:yes gene_type:complete